MKANELRLGNWVNLICDGHRDEPEAFQWLLEDYEYYEDNMFNILPIPLTEEWLLKFGFNKKNHQFYCKKIGGNVFVLINYNTTPRGCYGAVTFETDLKENSYVGHIKNSCKHVHQLQNLYFALTNEELTINESTKHR